MNRDEILKIAAEAGAFWELSETPEKDLAFLMAFAERIAKHSEYDGIHTCHDECQRPACVAVREAVASAVEPLQERIKDLYRQLDEAEKQLDQQYKLGAEAEREACAKVCEDWGDAVDRHKWPSPWKLAEAIRARGEK